MRFLFVTHPALGHFHPMVPFGRALQRAGHEVRVACARPFCSTALAAGFEATPAGVDWLESDFAQTFTDIASHVASGQRLRMLSDLFADTAAASMVPDLRDACVTWEPDALVRIDYEFGSCIVAELLGIPLATIAIGSGLPLALWRSVVGRPLTYLRQRWGLPGAASPQWVSGQLCLSLVPRVYHQPGVQPSRNTHHVRIDAFDDHEDAMSVAWPRDRSRPHVYVSLGTVFNRHRAVLQHVVDVLSTMPVEALVTVGPGGDRLYGDVPPHISVATYVPQSTVMPFCALVITTGGFNTVLGALGNGVPLLLLPFAADQFEHASRCAELGVGRSLESRRTADGRLVEPSIADIRCAIEEMIHDPGYRRQAQRIREEILSLETAEDAVRLLVAVASDRARLPAAGVRRS